MRAAGIERCKRQDRVGGKPDQHGQKGYLNVGAHHGMIVLGFAHAVKAVPAILGGLAMFAHAEERE